MPRSQQRASRPLPLSLPSDITLSIDSFDSTTPATPASNLKRPDSRHLVSPDDSARLMFFFGPSASLAYSCAAGWLFSLPTRHVLPASAGAPHMELTE